MIKTSVITPVWNRSDLTSRYLYDHFVRFANRQDIEWIIIDNGSTDETPGILQHWRLTAYENRLTVIRNEQNTGYSCANNQGAAVALGNVLIFLNNDIVIKGDYITPIEQSLTEDNSRAIVGAQLIDFDTGWNVFGGEAIPYLVGWCFGMLRSTFDDIGGFDERYTLDYEDSDLCKMATERGYQLRELKLPIEHLGNQTGKLLPDREAITRENRKRFAEKWGLIV